MAEKQPLAVCAAAYSAVQAAPADLDAIEQLHKDKVIGRYDAAVIDMENGKPHVAAGLTLICRIVTRCPSVVSFRTSKKMARSIL